MERLALAHRCGFNMIHPVPGGASYADSEGSTRSIEAYLDEASRLGIAVMYDMRHGEQHGPSSGVTRLHTLINDRLHGPR
jgi:hypothetical protein